MFRRQQVSRAVLALCTGGLAINATGQEQARTLERVEITGSNIKRVNAEPIAPVEVITRDQIARTGQATIADVLRGIPSNSGGSFGESASNSFAPGAAGISLRGLGQKTTLVLLNGRRVAGYGFAQNLQETFVDLNSIPASIVDRVEILKDGASAIYGSDAIAGVVNVITRKDFKGAEINLTGGTYDGKKDYGFTLSGGKGDLAEDRYNLFVSLDYYKRDELLLSDTEFGKSRDYRGTGGGRNLAGLSTGGTWRELTATGALSNNYRAITNCPGKVMTAAQAVEAGLLAATSAANLAGNTFCTRDVNDQISALPGTERTGLWGRSNFQLSDTTTAFAEFQLNRNKTEQTFTRTFFAGTTGLVPTSSGLRPYTYNINFAPGVAGNPFSNNARYTGSLNDMDTRNNEITSDTLRLLTGAKYTLKDWDFDSAVGMSQSQQKAFNTNRLSLAGVASVFNIPTTPQPPVPLSSSSSYNLDNWASNSAAVRDQLRANFERKAKSNLAFIDTKASTELTRLTLPGGPVGLALGAEARREKLEDSPATIASSGGVLGQGITATDGSRSNQSVYGELALPILKTLEAQVALRRDHYSDYGSSTTPKVGAKLQVNDMIAMRANWGKGFRAPTLPEISKSTATFFQSVVDPQDGQTRQISGVYAGNPNLKAETSRSANIGLIIEPSKNFSVGLDWYRLTWENVVAAPDFQDLIRASCPNPPSKGGSDCPSTDKIVRDPSTNQVTTILSNYENIAQRKTSGLDIDARWTIPTESWGKFGVQGGGTYVRSFSEDGKDVVGTNDGANTIPRFKASLSLNWDYGPASVTLRNNYTRGWKQKALGDDYFVLGDQRFQTGVYPERVASYSTFDIFGRYNINKNLTISGSILNLTQQKPPFDPGFSSSFLYDYSQFDVRDRQYRLGLKYTM